jgi:hypothetical protein
MTDDGQLEGRARIIAPDELNVLDVNPAAGLATAVSYVVTNFALGGAWIFPQVVQLSWRLNLAVRTTRCFRS